MKSLAIGVLTVLAGAAALDPASAGVTHHGHTATINGNNGPLQFTNPPTAHVVNNGNVVSMTGGTPALSTNGSVTIVNNGNITATVTSGTRAVAVGIGQN